MNAKTKIYFNLAKMYDFVCDASDIWNNEDPKSKSYKHSINMCLLQIGEYANRISQIQDEENIIIVSDKNIDFKNIRGIRNRIAHSYTNIDYSIIDDVMNNDIPNLKNFLESFVNKEILDDPYILYESEYND